MENDANDSSEELRRIVSSITSSARSMCCEIGGFYAKKKMNALHRVEELLCLLTEWDERQTYYGQVPTYMMDCLNELLIHLHN